MLNQIQKLICIPQSAQKIVYHLGSLHVFKNHEEQNKLRSRTENENLSKE